MKIKFNLEKQRNPLQEGGINVPYAAGKRAAFRFRWYLIVLLISSPLLIFAWYVSKDKIMVEAPGVLTTEPLTLYAEQDGTVAEVAVKQGLHLQKNTPLVGLANPILTAEITQLDDNIRELSQSLTENWAQQALLLKQKSAIASADLKEKNKLYQDYNNLKQNGLLQSDQWFSVSQLKVNADLTVLDCERSLQNLEQEKVSGNAVQYLNALKLRLQLLKTRANELSVKAPMDGEVKDILIQPGMAVKLGDPLLLYAIRSQPVVVAYLAPSDVSFSTIGQKATVTLPGGETLEASVSEPTRITEMVPAQLVGPFEGNKEALKVVLRLDHVPVSVIEGLSVSVRFHYSKDNIWSHIRSVV
jgi:multidrug resistance efflux pump